MTWGLYRGKFIKEKNFLQYLNGDRDNYIIGDYKEVKNIIKSWFQIKWGL
jgi:hypothetical protein